MTPDPALAQALSLTRQDDGLEARISGAYSNGPSQLPPEAGSPFGGLIAALSVQALRDGLKVTAPLRSLSVQYLAAARYGTPLTLRPQMLRAGRNVTYATVGGAQGERMTHHAAATFGADAPSETDIGILGQAPPGLDSLASAPGLSGPMAPHFSHSIEYRFEDGPRIFSDRPAQEARERLWMRTRDGAPLDDVRLCYLLDALYPPAWTAMGAPLLMTSVDLRYDILADPTPRTAPDGWAFFEYRLLDHGRGWSLDDATCWGSDGRPLAIARQRRKVL